MTAEKVLRPVQNRAALPSVKSPQQAREMKYCGSCPACRTLKATPASSPKIIAEALKAEKSGLANKGCISGFLQEKYGNNFTQRVFEEFNRSGVSAEKKISRAHAGETVGRNIDISGEKETGKHLDYRTRSFMESRMGHNFSDVKVHAGSYAAKTARDLNAHAYTSGRDIFFASGKYEPESTEGRKLLAHELTHAAQNKNNSHTAGPFSPIHGSTTISSPSDAAERQANAVSSAVVRNNVLHFPVQPVQTSPSVVYKKSAEEEEEKGGWLAEKIAGYAANIPGFTLVTFILGKNPITGNPVERNAKTFIEAVLSLIPGGAVLFKNLNESGAIDQAFEWLSEQIKTLNLTWEFVKGLIKTAWGNISVLKGIEENIAIVKTIFAPTFEKIKSFAVHVGQKVYHFVFEGALRLIGAPVEQIIGMLNKAGDAVSIIVKDPIAFLKNLLTAVKQGFTQFVSNIWEHLKTGLMGWLFGALEGAGIQIPKSWDLKSIFGLALQIMGITAAFIRKKVAKVIGAKNVELIEKAWEFISTLISSGISGLWEMIKEYLGSLKDMVLGAIQDWVVTKIITAAVTKLVSMFNPAGAIITAIQTIYNTVMFFIERMKQIIALVDAIFQSVLSIAQGAIANAADWIEKTMARTLPVIISFLARLIGLGGISDKIKEIIKKLQTKVEKAVDKVIDKVAAKVKGLLGKFLPGKKEKPMSPEVKKRWDGGMAEIEALQKRAEKDPEDEEEIKKHLGPIKTKYGFKKLDAKLEGNEWTVDASLNPSKKTTVKADTKGKFGLTKEKPITFNWPKYVSTILSRNLNGKISSPPEYKPFQKKRNEESSVVINQKKVQIVEDGKLVTKRIPTALTFERGNAVENYRKSHEKLIDNLEEKHKEGIEIHHKWPLFVSGPDIEDNLVPMLVAKEHRPWHARLREEREKSPQKGKTIKEKLGADLIGTFYQIPAKNKS